MTTRTVSRPDPVWLNRRKCGKYFILLPARSVTLVTSSEAYSGRCIAILLRFRAFTFVRLRSVKTKIAEVYENMCGTLRMHRKDVAKSCLRIVEHVS